ncbi:MAG: endonuclease III [Chloroflexi bacterium]|nr:endonuclease III [Chloroflexota bacterium]BCY17745.1 endonuclease III [Leptolinea sp. HRD-7]
MDELTARAQTIYHRLLQTFGFPEWRKALSPVDELVSTILSQNTNDRNRDVAFDRLKAAFPTWEDVRDADPDDVIESIRPAGLANQKGPRIQTVLKEISAERGNLDLSFLLDMTVDEARSWLLHFNGVGPKTAAIVLQFSLDKPDFPVDTHIYRVSGRLGLRPETMTVEQAHPHLASLFDPSTYGPAHLNLIRLGREICHARRPNCDNCPLNDICPSSLTRSPGSTPDHLTL